jgi:hypothetical protein
MKIFSKIWFITKATFTLMFRPLLDIAGILCMAYGAYLYCEPLGYSVLGLLLWAEANNVFELFRTPRD